MEEPTLASRYEQVKASLPEHVKLIAVSKTRSVEEIKALYDLGQRAFGENYPQEMQAKQPLLPNDIEWHFIGHLQSNKVKTITPFVHLVHGVDRTSLLDELDKRARSANRVIGVLLQVHIAEEETKHGFAASELRASLVTPGIAERWPSLHFRGLMGMATNTDDRTRTALEFQGLTTLLHYLQAANPFPNAGFRELSMGMSNDADLAIAAGSTMVRIGSAIFGARA